MLHKDLHKMKIRYEKKRNKVKQTMAQLYKSIHSYKKKMVDYEERFNGHPPCISARVSASLKHVVYV